MGRLKVEARRFQPASLPAVVLNAERGKAEQQARQLLRDPNQPSTLREMAEQLLRNSRAANAMRMTINAACPFIQSLAQQDSKDPAVRHLMLGVYNSAILYNAEMLTPGNAKIFHDQFGDFMESNLAMLTERADLQRERDALQLERAAMRQASGAEQPAANHKIIFLMTPFCSMRLTHNWRKRCEPWSRTAGGVNCLWPVTGCWIPNCAPMWRRTCSKRMHSWPKLV